MTDTTLPGWVTETMERLIAENESLRQKLWDVRTRELGCIDPVAYLRAIDAEQLEKEALGRLDSFDDGNATQAILDTLIDWLTPT